MSYAQGGGLTAKRRAFREQRASLPLLGDQLFVVLETELNKGAVAHGFADQTWTLARIKTLIGRARRQQAVQPAALLGGVVRRSVRGVDLLNGGAKRISRAAEFILIGETIKIIR